MKKGKITVTFWYYGITISTLLLVLLLSCRLDPEEKALKSYEKALSFRQASKLQDEYNENLKFLNLAELSPNIADSLKAEIWTRTAICAKHLEHDSMAIHLIDSARLWVDKSKAQSHTYLLLLAKAGIAINDHSSKLFEDIYAEIIDRATKENKKDFETFAKILLSQRHIALFDFQKAKSLLDSINSNLKTDPNKTTRAIINLAYSKYYQEMQMLPMAEKHAVNAKKLTSDLTHPFLMADCYLRLSEAKLKNKTLGDLSPVLDSCLFLCQQIQHKKAVAKAQLLKAEYLILRSRFKEAHVLIEKIQHVFDTFEDQYHLARLNFLLFEIYASWRNKNQKQFFLELAQKQALTAKNYHILLEIRDALVPIYVSKNDSLCFQSISSWISENRARSYFFGEYHALLSMGRYFRKKRDYQATEAYLDSAQHLAYSGGYNHYQSRGFSNHAFLKYVQKKHHESVDLYLQALSFDSLYSSKWETARNLFNLSLGYAKLKDYQLSDTCFTQAVNAFEHSANKEYASKLYEIKAKEHYNQAVLSRGNKELKETNIEKTITYSKMAIKLKEEIRQTADDESKMQYLDAEFGIYQMLISCYRYLNNDEGEFDAIETSKTKLLEEKIKRTDHSNKLSLAGFQASLDDSTVFLNFAKRAETFYHTNAITRTGYSSNLLVKKRLVVDSLRHVEGFINYIDTCFPTDQLALYHDIENYRKFSKKMSMDLFYHFIQYYRHLLQNNSHQQDHLKEFRTASRVLYNFLVEPFHDQIKGKKKLVIIPDGFLGLIPFETLLNDSGRYLVQDFDIQYIQSVGVWDMLSKREFAKRSCDLIAFGGAQYEGTDFEHNNALDSVRGNTYKKYGYTHFHDIPSSAIEIKNISQVFDDKKNYIGEKVSESLIKELSEKKKLSKYRILHFSTHGVFIPKNPKFSAIVIPAGKNTEDGFLTASEISELKLNADFVNLSACETGLGEIHEGEGVVGIAQSFVVAGANAMSVSLWQVADQSTALFMSEFYKLVNQESMEFAEAMNKIKRDFISGKYQQEISHPYYWAPFVYYGR